MLHDYTAWWDSAMTYGMRSELSPLSLSLAYLVDKAAFQVGMTSVQTASCSDQAHQQLLWCVCHNVMHQAA